MTATENETWIWTSPQGVDHVCPEGRPGCYTCGRVHLKPEEHAQPRKVTLEFEVEDLREFLSDMDSHGLPDLRTKEGTDTILLQLGRAYRMALSGHEVKPV